MALLCLSAPGKHEVRCFERYNLFARYTNTGEEPDWIFQGALDAMGKQSKGNLFLRRNYIERSPRFKFPVGN